MQLALERARELKRYLAEDVELSAVPEAAKELCGEPASEFVYVPDFVSQSDEEAVLRSIARSPRGRWKTLRGREVQIWGGVPPPPPPSPPEPSSDPPPAFRPEALPKWMSRLCDRLVEVGGVFGEGGAAVRPNHVLLNKYLAGQGIAAHKDGPLYHPVVAILSLGAPTALDFFPRLEDTLAERRQPSLSLYLRPRSLVVFRGSLYVDHWHEIAERDVDPVPQCCANAAAAGVVPGDVLPRTGTRYSLTIRHVPDTQRQRRQEQQ